jgi:hypothetical protein
MALVLADRVYETSTTVGTGTLTLAGALNSYQTFSAAIGNGNTCYYALAAVGGTDWEVGIGTVGAGTLARTTILSSSNSNLVVNLPVGTVNVFVTYPSEKSVNLDASGNATALGTPAAFTGTNITGTAASLTAGTVTDGVYTTGSYSNPAWITALANSKITGLGSAALLTAGSALGVATLDGGGTVPTAQLPAAVLGALKYQGTWNATTNVPTLTSSVGTQGYYYVVATAGTTNLDGIASWAIGDWAIFGTATWQKIDNTDAVTSVNGYTGTVSLAYADLAGAIPTWNQNTTGNAATVTTNANLTGDVTSVGNTTTLTNAPVIAKVLTGYTSGAGTVAATDSILQAVQKLNGNTAAIVGGPALSNDTATATNVYPIFASATTGTPTTIYTSNTKLLYKPSTGELAVTAPVAANGLVMNATSVSSNYTIAAGFNACSVGPITVSGGVAITITSGQRWLVL